MSCHSGRVSLIFFLRTSEILQPFLVPFAGLSQGVLIANQNFSCFNLSPFPCVCYSLTFTLADLVVGRRAGAHDGSVPGFSFARVAGHSLPHCSQGLVLARMQGAGVARLGVQVWAGERGRVFGSQGESRRIL